MKKTACSIAVTLMSGLSGLTMAEEFRLVSHDIAHGEFMPKKRRSLQVSVATGVTSRRIFRGRGAKRYGSLSRCSLMIPMRQLAAVVALANGEYP